MSFQYLATTSFPKNKTEVLPRCTIPGGNIITCGFVPLQLMLSRVILRVESFLCGTTMDTKSARVERALQRTSDLRHLFLNELALNRFPMKKSHSHAVAASYRTAMNHYLKNLVRQAGYDPYLVSKSAMDEREGVRGTRLFHGLKDLTTKYCNDPVKDNDVLIMVDVDYYADMNVWLRYNRPILLYTLVPENATWGVKEDGEVSDFAYRIVDNRIDFRVAGGANYSHELWDYGIEKTSVTNKDGTMTTFLVEQRRIDGDPLHRFVVLTPEARVAMPARCYLEELHSPLQRWQPLQNGLNVLFDPIKDHLSISVNGSWQSVQITGRLYQSIKTRVDAKTSGMAVSDIERMLTGGKHIGKPVLDAPLLYNMMGATLRANVVATNGAINYQPIGSLATEDGKPSGARGATPLVSQSALFPNRSLASDEAAIRGRIVKVRNDVRPPAHYKQWANEFVQRLVPQNKVGTGVPLSVAEVKERQNKPSQQARFKMIEGSLSLENNNRIKTFIKVEPYAGVNDPRIISTMDPAITTLLSAYTLVMSDTVLKEHKWYGAGLTPDKQVKRLMEVAQRGKNWLCTDFSRLDGTVSEFLQKEIVQASFLRWVNKSDRSILKGLLDKVFIKRAVTSQGVKFDPGWGTRSGSPQTTSGNTEICGFVVYAAYRQMGYTPAEAWEALSLLYGDDGAHAADDGLLEAMELVARQLGLRLKCEVVARGQPVPFLGRYFVDPCTMSDSFQDPIRTLQKIHLTPNRELTPAQAMANKAYGYLATDSKTPLIGTWSRKILELTGCKGMREATHEEIFKANNSWPQENSFAIAEAMAKMLNVSTVELLLMDEIVKETDALDMFPVLIEIGLEAKIDAVVDGEVVYARPTEGASCTPLNNDDESTRPKSKSTTAPRKPTTMDSNRPRRSVSHTDESSGQGKRVRNESRPNPLASPRSGPSTDGGPKSNRQGSKDSSGSSHWRDRRPAQPGTGTTRTFNLRGEANVHGDSAQGEARARAGEHPDQPSGSTGKSATRNGGGTPITRSSDGGSANARRKERRREKSDTDAPASDTRAQGKAERKPRPASD